MIHIYDRHAQLKRCVQKEYMIATLLKAMPAMTEFVQLQRPICISAYGATYAPKRVRREVLPAIHLIMLPSNSCMI